MRSATFHTRGLNISGVPLICSAVGSCGGMLFVLHGVAQILTYSYDLGDNCRTGLSGDFEYAES